MAMATYNIHEAKSQLSKLIEAVQRGETVVIAKAGKPVAQLGPLQPAAPPRVLGILAGQVNLGPEFDAPLPAGVLDAFENPD
jgi:prevent-host-death family protein